MQSPLIWTAYIYSPRINLDKLFICSSNVDTIAIVFACAPLCPTFHHNLVVHTFTAMVDAVFGSPLHQSPSLPSSIEDIVSASGVDVARRKGAACTDLENGNGGATRVVATTMTA